MVDEPRARECLALGAQFVAVALDTVMLRNGLDGAAMRFRGAGQTAGAPANSRY
jgi:4-hydroxy-2-oxoheptanedioate aldolase